MFITLCILLVIIQKIRKNVIKKIPFDFVLVRKVFLFSFSLLYVTFTLFAIDLF